MTDFSDFIVYADESGDHGMVAIDQDYPVFVLAFCAMRKDDYADKIVPAMQKFKFGFWGHDAIVLRGYDIRRSRDAFSLLRTGSKLRDRFFMDLNTLIRDASMTIFASVIDKKKLKEKYSTPRNPYKIALGFCMEQLNNMLLEEKQEGKTVHIVFESRGSKEDNDLEREFLDIAENKGHLGYRNLRTDFRHFVFKPVFIPKAVNSSGLQLADLAARPIGVNRLRPKQENRAFEIIRPKLAKVKYFPEHP